MDCKKCSACEDPHDEDKMMFCDRCDRGFHTYCAGLSEVPSGSFFCKICDKLEIDTRKIIESEISQQHTMKVETNIVTKNIKSSASVSKLLSTPGNNHEKKLNARSDRTVTPKDRSINSKRGRPLGSLNKPKDPNSPKKLS